MKGLQPAINSIQSLKEGKRHSNKKRRRIILQKVKEREDWLLWMKSPKKLCFVTSPKENTVGGKKSSVQVLTVNKCSGEEHNILTDLPSPAQIQLLIWGTPTQLLLYLRITLLQGEDPYTYSHTTSSLPIAKKAGDESAVADSPTPAPTCGNRRLFFSAAIKLEACNQIS